MSGKLIGANGRNIRSYAAQLVAALRGRQLPEGITSEQDFKREVVFPAARDVAAGYPDIRVYTPPWHNERICGSHPASSAEAMEPGCPVCWKEMKKWGSVDVF